jgi:hypothetical protein
MAEASVPSCHDKSLAAGLCRFTGTGYWVLSREYFYLFFVHLPSMTGAQLVPSDDISNLNV